MRRHRFGIELMMLQAYPGADGTSPVHLPPLRNDERIVYELRSGDPPLMSVEEWMGMNVKSTQWRQQYARAKKMLRGQ